MEFIAKLGIVEQELDETLLWLELLTESGVLRAGQVQSLADEADELLKIIVSSIKRSKPERNKP